MRPLTWRRVLQLFWFPLLVATMYMIPWLCMVSQRQPFLGLPRYPSVVLSVHIGFIKNLTNPTHWNMMMNLKLLPLFEIADHGSFPSSPSLIIDNLEHRRVSFLVLICMCASCSLYQVFLLGSMNSWKIESSSSFILWTISWTNARNNTMLLFLIFLRVILSLYFVGACSWDGSSHSSELYSSWVCTNTLH